MNYTREPIVESVVTPREGCKLVLRNSKKSHEQEDFLVDAVEIVSFGSAIFYRSTERPKPFLLPVSDYELIELKETKMVLKAVSPERAIKIAGGKPKQKPSPSQSKEVSQPSKEEVSEKKSLKRRTRRKKHDPSSVAESENKDKVKNVQKGGDKNDEMKVSSSSVRGLLPPPTTLIKESLTRIKNEELSKEPVEKKVDTVVKESIDKAPSEKKPSEDNLPREDDTKIKPPEKEKS